MDVIQSSCLMGTLPIRKLCVYGVYPVAEWMLAHVQE